MEVPELRFLRIPENLNQNDTSIRLGVTLILYDFPTVFSLRDMI